MNLDAEELGILFCNSSYGSWWSGCKPETDIGSRFPDGHGDLGQAIHGQERLFLLYPIVRNMVSCY